MTCQLPHMTRELHSRSGDGIDVRLLWGEHDGRVVVAVADTKTGDRFAVEVREGDRALDVFHHPFSYAACRSIATGQDSTGTGQAERLAA